MVVFDFDGTLCDTKEMDEGKKIWSERHEKDWPYRGWWGRPDSIDWETFKTEVIPWTYKEYLNQIENSDYVILATGRLENVPNMRENVEKILRMNNLSFSEIEVDGKKTNGVFLNTGGDTFNFKINLFEYLIDKYHIEEFTIYDDRKPHLEKFHRWAQTQGINIKIVDAVNHTTLEVKNNI